MTNTPNTGYWMPDYAYHDYLEERGWNVDELRECEEWCYPFGFGVDDANGYRVVYGEHNYANLYETYGVSYSGAARSGCFDEQGDSEYGKFGDGDGWSFYD